jgi:hypothetical protein
VVICGVDRTAAHRVGRPLVSRLARRVPLGVVICGVDWAARRHAAVVGPCVVMCGVDLTAGHHAAWLAYLCGDLRLAGGRRSPHCEGGVGDARTLTWRRATPRPSPRWWPRPPRARRTRSWATCLATCPAARPVARPPARPATCPVARPVARPPARPAACPAARPTYRLRRPVRRRTLRPPRRRPRPRAESSAGPSPVSTIPPATPFYDPISSLPPPAGPGGRLLFVVASSCGHLQHVAAHSVDEPAFLLNTPRQPSRQRPAQIHRLTGASAVRLRWISAISRLTRRTILGSSQEV